MVALVGGFSAAAAIGFIIGRLVAPRPRRPQVVRVVEVVTARRLPAPLQLPNLPHDRTVPYTPSTRARHQRP